MILLEIQTLEETEPEIITYEQMMYTTTSVYLRTQPNTNSDFIMVLSPYTILTAEYQNLDDEWYYVSRNDVHGYIKAEFLRVYDSESYINIPLEFQYQDLVKDLIILFEFDVDENFFYGMMYTENRFNNEQESEAGAQGVLQIIPKTWRELYRKFRKEYPELADTVIDNPTDKQSNITLGMYYIKLIQDSYNCQSVAENASRILTTYNRGAGGANTYYETYGTYSSSYSEEILRAAEYIRVNHTWEEGL